MRKITITGSLVRSALDNLHRAHEARVQKHPDEEVRFSIDAFLMIALAIEGIGNEAGELVFDSWTWQRLERSDTPLKWRMVSGAAGRKAFDPEKEPLQTIRQLAKVRNEIAHPKPKQGGDEIILRSKDGRITRNVGLDQRLEDGDTVFVALGKLWETYNAASATGATRTAVAAMRKLRDHLEMSGLDWIDDTEKDLEDAVRKWSV